MSFQNLSAAQLADLHNSADQLLPKFQAIAATMKTIVSTYEEMPNEDELDALEKTISIIAGNLRSIPGLVENLPSADDLDELERKTSDIANNLSDVD